MLQLLSTCEFTLPTIIFIFLFIEVTWQPGMRSMSLWCLRILLALLTWMSGIQKYKRSKYSRNCWSYECMYTLSGFHRVVALTKTTIFTCYYFNQECDDFFDRIGKTMLKRMYVLRSSVLNIDWNIFLMYYLNYYLLLFYIVICT